MIRFIKELTFFVVSGLDGLVLFDLSVDVSSDSNQLIEEISALSVVTEVVDGSVDLILRWDLSSSQGGELVNRSVSNVFSLSDGVGS